MRSRKIERLGNGLKRETKVYDSGASKQTVYRDTLLGRQIKSVEQRDPPRRAR